MLPCRRVPPLCLAGPRGADCNSNFLDGCHCVRILHARTHSLSTTARDPAPHKSRLLSLLESHRQAARDQLHALSDSLQLKVSQLEESNRKLGDSEQSRREFIADLSHSLGTPLHSINLGLQTLESNRLEEQERRNLIQRLTRQIDWVNTSSKRLMCLSRWDMASPEVNLKPVLLSEPILDAVEVLEDQLLEANINLNISGMRGIRVMADKEYLRDIVTALMENSVQHSGGNCNLYISVEPNDNSSGAAVIEIRDTGVGIESSEVSSSLQRYYTKGGTGLGLPLAAHLVRAHGSELIIESGLGQGFKASICLCRVD